MRRFLAGLPVIGLIGVACSQGLDSQAITPRVTPLFGDVRIANDSGSRLVHETEELALGDAVITEPGARALVELPRGQKLQLAPVSGLRLDSAEEPKLLKGSMLAAVPGTGLSVRISTPRSVSVRGQSAVFRLDRSSSGSVRVGVYRGAVSVPGSGWGGEVAALRQATVIAGGTLLESPIALQVGQAGLGPKGANASPDAWDRLWLGDAIDVGGSLEALERGMEQQLLAQRGRASQILNEALPRAIRAPAARPSLRRLEPAEALVASAVAVGVAEQADATSLDTFIQIARLRDLLADWIVVAAEWALGDEALDGVDAASNVIAAILLPAQGLLSTSLGGAAVASTEGTDTGGPGGRGGPGGGGEPDPPEEPACASGDALCQVGEGVVSLGPSIGTDPGDPLDS